MKVIKRDGSEVKYDGSKIILAIEKAMKFGSGIFKPEIAEQIESEIFKVIQTTKTLTIFQIEDMVVQTRRSNYELQRIQSESY